MVILNLLNLNWKINLELMLSLNYIFIFKSVNMKCHSDKINNFLNSDNVDLITKEFVINLFTKFIKNVNEDIISSKILFIDLGFYEVEKSDLENEDEDELEVIDFYESYPHIHTPLYQQFPS